MMRVEAMPSDNANAEPSSSGPAPRAGALAWLALWVPLLVALAASSVLLVDYVRPVPVFCAQEGGCSAVRHTSFAYPGGLPLPALGIAGFVAVAVLLSVRGARARMLHLGVAGLGAVAAVFLIALQVRLGTFCPYCMAADLGAILGLGVAYVRARRAIDRPPGRVVLGAALALAVVCLGTPAALGSFLEPKIPAAIRAEIAKTPRGRATVVDFVDFQCPFCRQTHKDLAPLVAAHAAEVRVVRKHVPLAMHVLARDAARAACCAEPFGKGDDMADALVAAPLSELTPDGCAGLGARLGLDAAALRACMSDPATDARIDADRELFLSVGGEGLPTLWIGTEKIEGAQGPEVLRRALDRAIAARAQ